MNILFLTIVGIDDISERGIYTDLMRHFRNNGHGVYVACPKERRYRQQTCLKISEEIHILNIKTLNLQKTSLIEKGLSTLILERQFLNGIKKHFGQIKFDLVLYSTPPITFTKVISYIKKKDNAKSYLLLKDIFPQNAVDLGMLKQNGLIHRYFKKKEKKLYQISDHIGVMSDANAKFIIKHNPKDVDPLKVEINPNSLDPFDLCIQPSEKKKIRESYGIPENAVVFIYGGNLGKPQGIDFLLEVLKSNIDHKDRFFLIVGTGTEYLKLNHWFENFKPSNALLLSGLPKSSYDLLLSSCDVGMIFLDKRFTIPNFPSRILSYMECKMPVIAATDMATDIGDIIVENKFGSWVLSGDLKAYNDALELILSSAIGRINMGMNGYNFMISNYSVKRSYQLIMKHFSDV